MKRYIPNILTLLNLFCALPAIESALAYDFHQTAFWMSLSLLFDFTDGLAARAFKSDSQLGVQLDSLADVVSFGVVPSFVLYKQMHIFVPPGDSWLEYSPYLAFLISLGSAFRLARFNLDQTQSYDFRGLPTPSSAIFVMGIPFLIEFFGKEHFRLIYFMPLPVVLFWVMNSNVRLFGFKVRKPDPGIWLKVLFLLLTLVFLLLLKLAGLSFVILLYVVLSICFYHPKKIGKNEIQG
ncbi:MAG: CDP-alcohol phosphatidyltransferase family protein [Thermaurantimonas sp.]